MTMHIFLGWLLIFALLFYFPQLMHMTRVYMTYHINELVTESLLNLTPSVIIINVSHFLWANTHTTQLTNFIFFCFSFLNQCHHHGEPFQWFNLNQQLTTHNFLCHSPKKKKNSTIRGQRMIKWGRDRENRELRETFSFISNLPCTLQPVKKANVATRKPNGLLMCIGTKMK